MFEVCYIKRGLKIPKRKRPLIFEQPLMKDFQKNFDKN